jgi:acyl-homoserine lactone acylase PvdQ
MTQTEKETIETFYRILALELSQSSGKPIDLNPDWLYIPLEDNPQAVNPLASYADRNDANKQ